MHLVLNPFFYYIAHQENIENFIIIESHGEHPHLMQYNKLKPIVERFVSRYNESIDDNRKEKYILYICDKLSHESGT